MADPGMILSQQMRLQQVLAPQLRQSLEILQIPILELRTMVQQELEKNPTLEEIIEDQPHIEIEPGTGQTERAEKLDFKEDFQVLAKLDDEWREYFFQEEARNPYSSSSEEKRQFFFDSLPQRESLQEHLMLQLDMAGFSEADHQVGELLIGSINDDGYLTSTPEELAQTAALDIHRLSDVLDAIHDFDPVGIGARSVKECLSLQLARLGKTGTIAYALVQDHLDLLGGHKYQEIAHAMKVPIEEIQKASALISTLDPKPGRSYSTDVANYVMPEVMVMKNDDAYVVMLNDEHLPHVRISNMYRKLMSDASTTKEVKDYILERIRSGVFIIKSINQRQQTIYKIASAIVAVQTEFLEKGVDFLKPLTMSQVADEVGMHDTTISRAVSGKYMQTPRGVFDMKYFFTPGFKTSEGAQVSNETVKTMIAQLVAEEDAAAPLSDQDILAQLAGRGINIARRTIAKYRLILRIPPSHMRKSC